MKFTQIFKEEKNMFTKKRKVIYSLIAATLFSSSAASAASFELANLNCNSILNNCIKEYITNCNYDCNKNSNTQQNAADSNCFNFDLTSITSKLGNIINFPAN